MNPNMLDFTTIRPNKNVVDEALMFDVDRLEQTDAIRISQYTIALSQYLIFFRAELNRTRADIMKKRRFIDSVATQLMTKDLLKQYKTKSDAKFYLISITESLSIAEEETNELIHEEQLLDGMDKVISELIASFKRELTRREQEMYAIRKDRN